MLVVSIVIIVALILAGLYSYKIYNSKQKPIMTTSEEYDLTKIRIEDIDKMLDGSEFEMYLYRLFLKLGYDNVYKTVGSRDFGADVVFTDREGVRNVIQAKRYSIDKPVGISAVQEIYSSMRFYKAKKAIVIATTKYTESCEILAGINHVKLLDRNDLINIIEAFKQGDTLGAKDIIEAEPRVIYESWSELKNEFPEFKKDKKAERYVKSM